MPIAETLADSGSSARLSPGEPYRSIKQAGLALLCVAWIALGLFGHDPWKPDDATSFGMTLEILKHGDWVVPHLAGVALPDRAPLFYAASAVTAKVFGGVLPAHDAARIAIAVCLALTLWLLSLTGRELYGRDFRWLPVLIFIGCVGLWDRAHQLSPDLGALMAFALALYALAIAPRRMVLGGALLGIALGLAFLFKGTSSAALIAVTAVLLAAMPPWRTPRYVATLAVALLVAAPMIAAWPLALYNRDPGLFAQWLEGQDLARYFGTTWDSAPSEPFYYLKNLPWIAWPALPLAVWTLRVRATGFGGGLAGAGVALPLIMMTVVLCGISVASDPRATLALPLLLPMSLLAAAEIDTLKRGYSGALDWFGILTFGLLGVLLWGLWLESLLHGLPDTFARVFRDIQPGYRIPWQWAAVVLSTVLTLLWLALVRPARRSNRRAMLNWAAGITLVWGMYMTLWLPYLDSRRSYRAVMASLATHLPTGTCVASHNLGEPQRALLEYFLDVVTIRDDSQEADHCDALLVQAARDESDEAPDASWQKIWEGHRRGDDTERLVLFRRPATATLR
jgi:4-amino-4-deoxy-L-arabinose transferase-like glycosyltransferase